VYQVRVLGSARAFLDRAESWLLLREDRHNLVLSLAYQRVEHEVRTRTLGSDDQARPERAGGREPLADERRPPFYATVEADGGLVGCALRTPPHKVLVTEMPLEAGPVLAAGLAVAFERIPAVLGPASVAEAVAVAWVRARGGGWRPGMEQGVYRLDEVTSPTGVPGVLRVARSADFELAAEWGEAFARDAGVQFRTSREAVSRWIDREALHLWEVEGVPVSIAVAQGRTPRGIRIGYVYTPPEQRKRGYASALVAALSGKMLESGIGFCVLYTDLSNPTSNAIYQRVGYELIQKVRDFDLVGEDRL
jgi:uncharacterized protein